MKNLAASSARRNLEYQVATECRLLWRIFHHI